MSIGNPSLLGHYHHLDLVLHPLDFGESRPGSRDHLADAFQLHNSRYIPQKPIVRLISSVWHTCAENPWSKVPHKFQVGLGWGAVLVLFLASAFGIASTAASPYKWRAVSLCGILVMYGVVYLLSAHRSRVTARPVILGLCMQVILGLFVFKSVSRDNHVLSATDSPGCRTIPLPLDLARCCRLFDPRCHRRSLLFLA
jgi:hypothetical protein